MALGGMMFFLWFLACWWFGRFLLFHRLGTILVGGLEHDFYFSIIIYIYIYIIYIYNYIYILGIILPTDFHIFQRGRLKPPTRWTCLDMFGQKDL